MPAIRTQTASVNTLETEGDVEAWALRHLDKNRDQIEVQELDPEYHDGELAFDLKIKHGVVGDDLRTIMDRFEIEEVYVNYHTKRFGCNCCGDITTGWAEFTVRP